MDKKRGKAGTIQERLIEITDHPARIIDLVAERMDLSSLYECYGEEGNPL